MKKCLIKAYSQLNLGDDLFIKILVDSYKNIDFYLFSNKNYRKFGYQKNLQILKNNFYQRIINKLIKLFKQTLNYREDILLKKVQGIIEIGGSLFIEDEYYEKALKERERSLEKIRGNYFILGSNFGPFLDDDFKNSYQRFFSKCKDVCFREKYSFDLFKDLENVRMAKDIVFGLDDTKSSNKDYILFSIIKPSLRKELRERDEEYYSGIVDVSLELLKEGKSIKYMSFCKFEGDEDAIQEIISRIPKDYLNGVSTYYYSGDLTEALGIIKKSEIIVATRFHAMILGFVYEKKVLPIAYSKKTTNVLKDLEFLGEYVDFEDLSKLNKENILNSQILEPSKLELAKKDSMRHFEVLDKILLRSETK